MTTDLVRRFDGPKDNAADDGVADEQDRQSDGRDLRLTVAQMKSQMSPMVEKRNATKLLRQPRHRRTRLGLGRSQKLQISRSAWPYMRLDATIELFPKRAWSGSRDPF